MVLVLCSNVSNMYNVYNIGHKTVMIGGKEDEIRDTFTLSGQESLQFVFCQSDGGNGAECNAFKGITRSGETYPRVTFLVLYLVSCVLSLVSHFQ